MTARISRKVTSSAKNVASGTRKLPPATTCCAIRTSALGENEDEQHREGEVDEVHRLDQADRQEEQGLQRALCLGRASHTRDQLATGETVTDRGTDRATAQCQAAADEAAGQLDCLDLRVSHFLLNSL